MSDLHIKLEEYRLENRLSKAVMGELLGASHYQGYHDWIKRGSIPKKYLKAAEDLLAERDPKYRLEKQIAKKVANLPEAKAKLVLQMIDGLLEAQ